MSRTRRWSSLVLLAIVPALLGTTSAAAAQATDPVRAVPVDNALSTSGPPLRTSAATLAASLRCTGDVAASPKTPVLLLHGTGSTPEESWGPVYLPQLQASDRPVCTVALPGRATGDMQVSTEYVVSAIRSVAKMRHGRLIVLGHSQGATLAVTALKFWPDLAGLVEDSIGLAPTLQPGVTGDATCLRPCSAPFQQRRADSVYFTSVLAHPLPPGPAYTTIATRFDEIAAPAPQTSRLEGATNVVVQDPCPSKVVDHFGLLTDGTVFALVLDGVEHTGPVDIARLPLARCLDTLPPGSDPATVAPLVAQAIVNDLAANGDSEKLSEEPAVRCYVQADCDNVDERGRLLTGAALVTDGLRLTAQAPGQAQLQVIDASGRVVRTVSTEVQVGSQRIDLPRAAPGRYTVRVSTTTGYYRVVALEVELPLTVAGVAAAPEGVVPVAGTASPTGGGTLPSTGAPVWLPAGGLLLLAALAVARRRTPTR